MLNFGFHRGVARLLHGPACGREPVWSLGWLRLWLGALTLVLMAVPALAQNISTVAGTGGAGSTGDGGPAISAQLNYPARIALDSAGNLYIADAFNQRIRKRDAVTGVITTVAGTGVSGYSGDGGPAISAQLSNPQGVAVDSAGNLYISEVNNNRIRKVDTSGNITTFAGTGTPGNTGDTGQATAATLNQPLGLTLDSTGNLYIADSNNHKIRKVDSSSGIITTVAGSGTSGYSGDGGTATSAKLNFPQSVAVDSTGNLYIADSTNNRVRKVDATGKITTFAGTGTSGNTGDGGLATSANLAGPVDVALDSAGNLFIATYSSNTIRKVDASTGKITTVAGRSGGVLFSGDGGPAILAGLNNPFGVAVYSGGVFYIADSSNNRIRKVDPVAPNTPGGVAAAAGNGQATVTFTAPTSDGGSAITRYDVTSSPEGKTCTATPPSTSCTVSGLSNETAYTFTVTATNDLGTSTASAASNLVTPSAKPQAPTIGTATVGIGQASVAFTAPTFDGGSAITGYTVTSSPGGLTGTGTTSPIIVTGLTGGTAYTFTVTATNNVGTGPASAASNSVTPIALPGAPTIGTATADNGRATVTFTAPTSNGGSAINRYNVTSAPTGGSCTATPPSTSCVVWGLTNGTAYTFTVTATNGAGTGPASEASNTVTPSAVPGAPTIGTATAVGTQATVTFTAPAFIGAGPISRYTVTSSPEGKTCVALPPSTSCVVTGLTSGTTYTFTVTASNSAGTGPASAASNAVTPSALPGAPTIGTATAGNTQATVTFTAPASIGGSAITRYTVTSSPEGKTCTATPPSTSCIVPGLSNGTAYSFKVTATNDSGTGPDSSASNAVTPSALPDAPTIGTATPGNGQATVTFTAPASDGGSAITSYTVTSSPGGLTGTGTASPITVSGLVNGQTYTFTVTATNNAGTGPASPTPSNPATPLVNAKSFTGPAPTGSGTVSIGLSAGGGDSCSFERVQAVSASMASKPVPAGLSFPHGLLDFVLAGCDTSEVTLTLTYPSALSANMQYWKLTGGNVWAPFAGAQINPGAATVTLTLRDGGQGDDDGVVNGRIVDPGQVAEVGPGGSPDQSSMQPIPTLSQWGLMVLSGLMVLGGLAAVRRRAY